MGWYPLFNGVMSGLFFGMLAVAGQVGLACGDNPRQSPQFVSILVLTLLIIPYFWHYALTRFTHLSTNMPYQDAVEVDGLQCAGESITSNFSADYYRDPIYLDKIWEDGAVSADAESTEEGSSVTDDGGGICT